MTDIVLDIQLILNFINNSININLLFSPSSLNYTVIDGLIYVSRFFWGVVSSMYHFVILLDYPAMSGDANANTQKVNIYIYIM